MSLPSLYLKNDVKINGKHFYPEIRIMIDVARKTAPLTMDGAVWITSANDGRHMVGSKHYDNEAFDIRIRNILAPSSSEKHAMARQWTEDMARELGPDYDVILESDHIHVERDPK